MISTTRRTPWREAVVAALVGFVAFRVATEAIGLLAAFRGGAAARLLGHPSSGWEIWKQWDVNWFSDIATRGYPAMGRVVTGGEVHDGTAFPPAMPALMRAGIRLGLAPGLTGVLVSGVCLLAGLTVVYALVRDDHTEAVARWTVVFLLVYPFSLFLGTGYAEALVLLAAAGAWLAARRRHWWLAGALVSVALLGKIVFILLLVPLTLEALESPGVGTISPRRRALTRLGALWLPPLVALGAWMAYLQAVFANPVRFLAAQRGLGRALGLPLAQVGYVFDRSRNPGVRFIDAIDTLSLVLLGVMAVYVYRRVRPAYGVLLGLMFLVFAFNTSLISNGRHLAVLFPIFLGLAVWTERRTWLRPVLVVAQLPLAVLLVSRFATGHWAG